MQLYAEIKRSINFHQVINPEWKTNRAWYYGSKVGEPIWFFAEKEDARFAASSFAFIMPGLIIHIWELEAEGKFAALPKFSTIERIVSN